MKNLFKFIIWSILLVTGYTWARTYHVEMIVFSHLTRRAINQEQWPEINSSDFDFSKAITLSATNTNSSNYRLLDTSKFILRKEQQQINGNNTYRTLLHIAWNQDIQGSSDARAVRIINDSKSVNGIIKINANRYLNVLLNILFSIPKKDASYLAGDNKLYHFSDPVYFYLSQTRRMRSWELNYIDFPLFGVLIKIIPITVH